MSETVTEQRRVKRKIKQVYGRQLVLSTILPLRDVSDEIVESVRAEGQEQALIVRPHPTIPNKYEVIDGNIRLRGGFRPNQRVLVDIRQNVADKDVFTISERTFKRRDRTAYEKAMFYKKWVDTIGGTGAQREVASLSKLSEPTISQYVKIAELFEKQENLGVENFIAIKFLSKDKLYATAQNTEDFTKEDFERLNQLLTQEPKALVERIRELIRIVAIGNTVDAVEITQTREVTELETIPEGIEQTETVPTEETRLRPIITEEVRSAFSDVNIRDIILQALKEQNLTSREDAVDAIERFRKWKDGEEVTALRGRPVPTDIPAEDAVKQITDYLAQKRVRILFKTEVLEELRQGYEALFTPNEFPEFVRQCSIYGLRAMIKEARITRGNLRLGDSDESERQD